MEGFLPWYWCVFWYAIAIPFVAYGIIQMKKITEKHPESKPLLAISGAYIFVLSSLHIPSVTGSSSHPTGNGLGTALFGFTVVSAICVPVLAFQALLLAHGGITTLGANDVSMGVVGPFFALLVWKLSKKMNWSPSVGIFLAAFVGDWMTYVTTATQLGMAFPIPNFTSAWIKMMAIYAYTQIPISIAESFLTVVVFEYIAKLRPDILEKLNVIKPANEEKSKDTMEGGLNA